MAASSETPAPSPTDPGDGERPSRPRVRGRRRFVIVGGAVVAVAALVAVGLAVGLTGSQDPGEKVPQPHRAAAAFPRPAAGQPRWAVPDHHWTALSKAWTAVGPGPRGGGRDADGTRLVSDGKRAIAYEAGLLTAYDGATGKQIWQRTLGWDGLYEPVAGDGVVIVPLHGSGGFSDCVTLDTATGAQRWRAPRCPGSGSGPVSGPVGALWHGVFYYTDGETVTGVDAATGKRRYQRKFWPYGLDLSTPVVANGRIALSAAWWSPARQFPPQSSGIRLLSPDLKTDEDIRLSDDENYAPAPDLPTVSGDVILARLSGAIWPIDGHAGRKPSSRWTEPQDNIVGAVGRTVVAVTPTFTGPRVSGYDLLTGAHIWSRESGSKWFSYDIEDGTLFALGNGVAIIDPTTGKTVFQRPSPHESDIPPQGRAVPAGGHIVVFDKDGITGYH